MERLEECVLVHSGQEAGMEPGLEGVLKNEPLVAATPNSELLWVFERDDFQDRSKEVLLAILLESQSWRSLRGCPIPKREEGKKREPFPSRPAMGMFDPNGTDSTDQRETCPQIPQAVLLEALLTLGFLAGPRADSQTIGRSGSQMPSAQDRWDSAVHGLFSLALVPLFLGGKLLRSRVGGKREEK